MVKSKQQLTILALWPWVLLILLLITLPYLLAWLAAPAGQVFNGSFVNHDDLPVYLSAMRQGKDGMWLYHFTSTPEPWQPRLMLLPYLLWGKLVQPSAETAVLSFHILRLLCVLFALFALLFWVRQAFPNKPQLQKTAWIFITLGGGLGWLVNVFWPGSGRIAPDLYSPEWTGFMDFFHTPHFALGLGLEALTFGLVLKLQNSTHPWRVAGETAVVAMLAGLTYVYHVPILGLVIGAFMLMRAVQQRRVPWAEWLRAGVILAPLLPLLFYYAVWVNQDPYFAQYAQQEHVIQPPPLSGTLIGWGILAILALFALRAQVRRMYSSLPFIWLWAGMNCLALYLPTVQFTGRFSLGLFVPIATLAAVGLEEGLLPRLQQGRFFQSFSRYTPTPLASLRRVFITAVLPTALIIPIWTARGAQQSAGFPYYMPQSEVQAMIWLGEHSTTTDVYLSDYPIANYLLRVAPGHTFGGHLDHTTNLAEKLANVQQFWNQQTPATWRSDFIQQWGITYIYQGAFEQNLMQGSITPPGELIYDHAGVRIYQVQTN